MRIFHTHHLDQRRGQRSLRREAIDLAAAPGKDEGNGRYRLTERERSALAAQFRADLRDSQRSRQWLLREHHALRAVESPDEDTLRALEALARALSIADDRISTARISLVTLERARGITVVCDGTCALTAWRQV